MLEMYLNNAAGPEVEVLPNYLSELLARLLRSPVVHHGDGERLSDSNGIGHL